MNEITEYSIFYGDKNLSKPTSHKSPREDLMQIIQKYTWSPYIYKNEHRSNENFNYTWLIGIDIDDSLPSNIAIERLNYYKLNFILTFTRNHQKQKGLKGPCDRYRIILFLKVPINERIKLKQILKLIQLKLFPELDSQTLDPARIFYPSICDANKIHAIYKFDAEDLIPDKHLGNELQIKLLTKENVPEKIKEFLLHPKLISDQRKWNENLNNLAFYMGVQGFEYREVETLYSEITLKENDSQDLAVIKSAYEAGQAKSETQGEKNEKNQMLSIFNFLKVQLDKIHLIQSPEGIINILLENEKQEVRYIEKSYLKKLISSELVKLQMYKNESYLKNCVDFFLDQKEILTITPPLISFKSSYQLSFKTIDFDPINNGKCPLFKEILSRCSNADALAAFIWSIFELNSDRQQYVWLTGDGQNGKGVLGRFISKLLGSAYCSEISNGIEDKHFGSNFIDKRLVHYPDNNDRNLTTTSSFKILTGGDDMKLNPKGRPAFTARLNLKVLIFSNKDPNISSQQSDMRRIIYCKLGPIKAEPYSQYENELWQERAAILGYCKSKYEELTVNHSSIKTQKSHAQLIAENNEEEFQILFDELFIVDPSYTITVSNFHNLLMESERIKNYQYREFKEWVLRKNGISKNESTRPRKIIGLGDKSYIYQSIHMKNLDDFDFKF